MSRVRRRQGLAAWRKALHLRMRRLRQADLGDGRHDHAWFEAAFARMVLGRLSHGHPFEWDFGAAIAKAARARLLQVGVAAVRQAAPRHGRAGPRAARRPRRGRRGRDPVADQGRSGLRRRRPLAPGQNVGRCRRSRKRRPRTPSPGRDQGLLRRLAAWLRRRQRRPGRDDQNRRLAVLRPRPRRPARAPCRRRHGRPCRSALGPPRLLQRQDLGARRLSRPAKTASPELPRRIRLPLQPTPSPPRRLPLPSRNRPRPQTTNLQYVDHAGSSRIRLRIEKRTVHQIADMMLENLAEDPGNDADMRLWLRAFRMLPEFTITEALERVSTWAVASDSLDAHYYLYILNYVHLVRGAHASQLEVRKNIEVCLRRAPLLLSKRSFEWWASEALHRPCPLVHNSELESWRRGTEYWANADKLGRVEGIVDEIRSPQHGTCLIHGLPVFFVPARLVSSADVNTKVSFHLGFSYEGLRAWNVQNV